MNQSNSKLRYLLSLCLISVLIGCSQKSPQVTKVEPDITEIEPQTSELAGEQPITRQADYQQGLEALALRDYGKAKRLFTGFIKANPRLSGAYVNLALIAFREDNFDSAEKLVQQAIVLNPEQAQAYHLRAQLHLKKGAIKLAQADYQKALELKPDYINAHHNLALLYDIFLQEIALAIDHYTKYLSLLEKEDEKTRNWVKHLQGTLDNG